MTLITHLKTKHFDIIMGDGRIMDIKEDDIKANKIKLDDAQKVYHTNDKNFLIGYSGNMYPVNSDYSTPKIIQSILSKSFNRNEALNKQICDTIIDATKFPSQISVPLSTLNIMIIGNNRTSNTNEFIPHHPPIKERFQDTNQKIVIKEVFTTLRTYVSGAVNNLFFSPHEYNEEKTYNGNQTFEDCLKKLSIAKSITIDAETDKDKLFKLLEEFYKNCVYTNPVTKGTIGGKITIIIKSLNNQEIETREFE